MNILGLSFDYHDAAAAIVRDGTVVAAAHEERFTRRKGDPSLPRNAVAFCLDAAGITKSDLDWVVHYEQPLLKFDRILLTALRSFPRSTEFLRETLADWLSRGKFEVRKRIEEVVEVPSNRIEFCRHHQSHAAAAFFCSPFEQAAIVTLDGVGEFETATISRGEGNKIRQISRVSFPNSLGLFYSAFTAYEGFEVNEGEYKVMGMAGFGEPDRFDDVMALFDLRQGGGFTLKQQLFEFMLPKELPFNSLLVEQFGEPRKPEAPFVPCGPEQDQSTGEDRRFANIAASVQKATEEVVLHVVREAMKETGLNQVSLAGGVALNSVANSRLKRELGCELYVHPAAGDAGSAIGAALHHHYVKLGHQERSAPLVDIYLGKNVAADEVAAALDDAFLESLRVYSSDRELVEDIAQRIADGAVIGWMQGRAEWGPRALGARSILADPTRSDMQGIVNEKIKFREAFRPFAPSVLKEEAHRFFELGDDLGPSDPESFMLSVVRVREDATERIPAVTHVDGTARVHLVDRAVNPVYYDLIEAFGRISGVPMLLNTSFNLRGEPIVNCPADAIKTFQWSSMDFLVMGRTLIEKEVLLA